MGTRRCIAALLLVALLTALLIVPAHGAANLAFVAVNDSIPLTLPGNQLPFYSNGVLYVPHTAFIAASLEFYPTYNAAKQTLTFFGRSERLDIDLAASTITDQSGNTQPITTYVRGGIVFVPAAFCASHFGLRTSSLTSRSGYTVVRFTDGVEVYDDSLFIERAENLIAHRVSQYENPTPPAEVTPIIPNPPAASVTPVTPVTPARPETPAQEPDEEEPQPPATILLAVAGADADALETLAQHQLKVAFFLTAAEIEENGDLVRRIAAAGHTVGLAPAEGTDAAESLRQANEALDRTLGRKSLLALASETADLSDAADRLVLIPRPQQPMTAQEASEAHGQRCLLWSSSGQLAEDLVILVSQQAQFSQLLETTALPQTEEA